MNTKTTLLALFSTLALVAAAAAADPKENWQKTCTKCHGADGKGETKIGKVLGIKDFTNGQYQDSLKEADMLKAIKEGIKDGDKTKMKPAEGLSDDEIKALVAYVRAFKK